MHAHVNGSHDCSKHKWAQCSMQNRSPYSHPIQFCDANTGCHRAQVVYYRLILFYLGFYFVYRFVYYRLILFYLGFYFVYRFVYFYFSMVVML